MKAFRQQHPFRFWSKGHRQPSKALGKDPAPVLSTHETNDVQNKWKVVNCINCKPPEWEFCLKRWPVIRGPNCDPGCNWVLNNKACHRIRFRWTGRTGIRCSTIKNKPEKVFVTASNNKKYPGAGCQQKKTDRYLECRWRGSKRKEHSTAGKTQPL